MMKVTCSVKLMDLFIIIKRRGETEKPREISIKTEIKSLTDKALIGFRISLSVFNFYTSKLVLLSKVLPAHSLVSAELIVI